MLSPREPELPESVLLTEVLALLPDWARPSSSTLALCTCVARRRAQRHLEREAEREARTEERRNSAERALFDGHNSSSRLLKRPEARERFACFLSHYKIQCASEARLLQAELEASLGRRCFLDSDDLKDLRQLADHVRSSDVLVLIQSSDVLSRPWCLLELLTAIDAGVPIVGVAITAGPAAYDFRAAAAFMGELDVPGRLDASAAQLLDEHGHTLEDAAWKLSSVLPQVISVPLDPFASRAVLAATVHDTVEAMRAARRGQLPDKTEWLRSRERPAALHGAAAAAPAAASASVPAQVPPLPDSLAACFPEGSSRKAMLADICKRLSEAGIAPAPAALPPALREHLMKRKESGEELLAEELEALNLPGATDGGAPAKPPTVVAARGIGGAGKTSLAVGVVLQKSMQEHFEAIVWTSAGQTPVLPALLRAQLAQLRRGADAGAGAGGGGDSDDVDALREAAQAAAKGRRVLLVLDDVWEPAHERALNFVTASDDGSAVLVTTRIRALVPESDEVEVGALSKREAVALLLRSGGINGKVSAEAEAAASEAAELCGCLPLTLAIAGALIADFSDRDADGRPLWETQLVPTLKESHGAELRESSDAGGESVEGRVIEASLACMPVDAKSGVAALFSLFATFAEDATVPASIFDALAPSVVTAARHALGGDAHVVREAAAEDTSLELQPTYSRRHAAKVRKWLQLLLKHSLVKGTIAQGVLMHDLVRDYVRSRLPAAQLCAMQHNVVATILEARSNSVGAAGPDAAHDEYVATNLRHHIAGAVGHIARLDDDDVLMAALSHEDKLVFTEAAHGVGAERLRAASDACEADGRHLAAATLLRADAAAAMYTSGASLVRAMHLLRKVEPEDDERRVKLELSVLPMVLWGDAMGTPDHELAISRIEELATSGQLDGMVLATARWSMFMANLFVYISTNSGSWDPDMTALHAQAKKLCANLVQVRPIFEELGHDAGVVLCGGFLGVVGVSFPRIHAVANFDWDAFCGAGGAVFKETIRRYEHKRDHPFAKGFGGGANMTLAGAVPFALAVHYEDLKGARRGWRIMIDAWRDVAKEVRAGRTTWQNMLYEVFALHIMPSGLLAAGEIELLREWFEVSMEGIALTDAPTCAALRDLLCNGENKQLFGGGLPWEAVSARMRGLAAYLEASPDDFALRAWLPTTIVLKSYAEIFYYESLPFGAGHPALLCATLHGERLGDWEVGIEVAEALLAKSRNPINRVAAHQLRSRCLTNTRKRWTAAQRKDEARIATQAAHDEAKRAGYNLLARSTESTVFDRLTSSPPGRKIGHIALKREGTLDHLSINQ